MSDTTACGSLYSRTLELVNSRPKHVKLRHMADAGGCSIAWVSRFQCGMIPDPSIHIVQRIHDFLIVESVRNDA